jgi:hypothetical protein
VIAASLACVVLGTSSPAIAQSTQERLEEHVTTLAAPELEGRGNGSEGLDAARAYIVEQMQEIGLEPAGEDGYLSPLEAVVRSEPSRSVSLAIGEHVLAGDVEFAPASFSDDGSFEAEAVFVGYGLSAPSVGYDDYAGVDVRDKVVVALTGAPAGHAQALTSDERAYLLSAGSKAAVALANGARALLLVNDPRGHGDRPEQAADQLPTLRPALPLTGISAGYLSEKSATRILSEAGVDLAQLQRDIDGSGEPHSRSLEMTVRGDLTLDRTSATLYNIVGRIAGTSDALQKPIVVTAHYDGLGYGHAGSLSRQVPALHPGADDNASGVAVLLEVARALAATPPEARPPILFAAPVGEELGLRGSRRLARQLVDTYGGGTVVNFDMLGRLRERELKVAHGADNALVALLDAASSDAGLTIRAEALTKRFSDHVSFVELGFRGVNITSGRHADYHVPGDTLDKINWEGLAGANQFVEGLLRRLARAETSD